MLKYVKIVNFRSLKSMELVFEKTNAIVGKNGVGKTNILQAICHIFWRKHNDFSLDDMLTIWENYMYLEANFEKDALENKITLSYDKSLDKKQIHLNGKKVTKKQLFENILKICYFSPLEMNLFYLWPKNRRDYLDWVLSHCFVEYEDLLKSYEKIVKNRNKVLKNISEWKSKKSEIDFWNESFILTAKKIYAYRIPLNQYIQTEIQKQFDIFQNKVSHLSYHYITKVTLDSVEESISSYLTKNFERDIILWKTHIGPHIDDFDIHINQSSLLSFASRWEIKSIILALKQIEISYIKKITGKEPILLIDDLWSELDEEHLDLILNKIKDIQIIYTSIMAPQKQDIKLFLI